MWRRELSAYEGFTGRVEFTYLVGAGASKEGLEELAIALAEERQAQRVSFVDFPELVVSKPSLGFWDRDLGPHLREKDWTKRPAPQDVQLWAERASISAMDDGAARELAAKHGLDTEMVKAGVERVRGWISGADV